VCGNPVTRERYRKDPLVWHGGIRARLGKEILTSVEKAMSLAHVVLTVFFVILEVRTCRDIDLQLAKQNLIKTVSLASKYMRV
jgi:hypothetical protein